MFFGINLFLSQLFTHSKHAQKQHTSNTHTETRLQPFTSLVLNPTALSSSSSSSSIAALQPTFLPCERLVQLHSHIHSHTQRIPHTNTLR